MTNIKEKEYDKKINISATKFSCDDIDDTIPKPLPQKGGFAMLIIGRPGYGKTSLINSLVCKSGKNFNRKFDKVFIWSPSMITMEGDPYEMIPEDQKFESANFENIQGVLDEIKDTGDKVLFIFDDVIADIRGKGKGDVENLLQKIFFNRRHLAGYGGSVSIMATSQTYNKIDPKLRKTASHLIQYKPQKKEIENIHDDLITIPKKEFMDVLRYIYKKKHDFMYIDTQQEDTKQLHKNFNQLIISSPNISDFSLEDE
jgi:GTPase SAR1 family protein